MENNLHCTLCKDSSFISKVGFESATFHQCQNCSLVFRAPDHLLNPEQERNHYLKHENDSQEEGYQKFINQAVSPFLPYLEKDFEGIDFGCGEDPATAKILKGKVRSLDLYDPFFFPKLPSKTYQFLISTETVEHFYSPADSFQKIDELVCESGFICIMSSLYQDLESFDNWYYCKDPTHVAFYNEDSIQYICEKYSWECLEIINNKVWIFQKRPLENSL